MPKKIFKNIQSFSEHFKVSKADVEKYGFFDITLSIDSDLYIDSKLLTDDNSPYFLNAASTLKKHFKDITVLLKAAKQNNDTDMYWKQAYKKMTFKELHGLCLGYGTNDIVGNGVGPVLRKEILNRLWTLIRDGKDSPELFDLICVFTEGFGCDRSSDLIANFIKDIIISYNEKIIEELNLSSFPMIVVDRKHKLLQNPIRKKLPILLVPKNILSKLPVCVNYFEIEDAVFQNEEARKNLQQYIPLKETISKDDIYNTLLNNSEFYEKVIELFKNEKGAIYDFKNDPKCIYKYRDIAKETYHNNPEVYNNNEGLIKTDIHSVVNYCVDTFKHLVEDCGLRDSIKSYDEKVSQHLFAATSFIYCELNGVALCPEMNCGRGPVDFFLTNGIDKVSVELKKISNQGYLNGLQNQLPDYMKSNKSSKGIYLVLNDVSQQTIKVKRLLDCYNSLDDVLKNKIRLIIINAFDIPSASVIKK